MVQKAKKIKARRSKGSISLNLNARDESRLLVYMVSQLYINVFGIDTLEETITKMGKNGI